MDVKMASREALEDGVARGPARSLRAQNLALERCGAFG